MFVVIIAKKIHKTKIKIADCNKRAIFAVFQFRVSKKHSEAKFQVFQAPMSAMWLGLMASSKSLAGSAPPLPQRRFAPIPSHGILFRVRGPSAFLLCAIAIAILRAMFQPMEIQVLFEHIRQFVCKGVQACAFDGGYGQSLWECFHERFYPCFCVFEIGFVEQNKARF